MTRYLDQYRQHIEARLAYDREIEADVEAFSPNAAHVLRAGARLRRRQDW